MILEGDAFDVLATLGNESVDCIVTSPPYWGLRDYGIDGQLGIEPTPEEYINKLRLIFEQTKRVLKSTGTLWLNLGDSYARNGGSAGGGNRERIHMEGRQKRMMRVPAGSGLKEKDLCGLPWRVALALQSDGWYLRQDIIWHKPNPMPESVRDRCTKAHEYIFLLAKSQRYYFDIDAIKEPSVEWLKGRRRGRNKPNGTSPEDLKRFNLPSECQITEKRQKRSVWSVTTKSFKDAHFAVFPPDLIEPCILAGCPQDGTVLDPFVGSGTVGVVAQKHGRKFIGIELNPEYCALARKRVTPPAAE